MDPVIDLESGGTTSEEDAPPKEIVSESQQSRKLFGGVWNGFLGIDGSARGLDAVNNSCNSPASSVDDNGEFRGQESVGLLEKRLDVEKPKKKGSKKPPKPPRPPKGPLLDAADQKLVREISELAMLKRARAERMKALKKMKASKTSSSSSSCSSVFAMVVTVLFCLMLILPDRTVVFDVEGTLLRSTNTFHYFMLVALEGGALFRVLLLLLLYPLICFVNEEVGVRVMVMVTFFGMRRSGFRFGRSVLPKHFLDDVGLEGFEVLREAKGRVGVSCLPEEMVEGFLREYMEVEVVVCRRLKVVGGFYVGLMEGDHGRGRGLGLSGVGLGDVAWVGSSKKAALHHVFTQCKRRPKPLIFHDGRIAFKAEPLPTLAILIWVPFSLLLSLFRIHVALFVPYNLSIPIFAFTGMKWRLKNPNQNQTNDLKGQGQLYVCNHRTLLDPIYVSASLNGGGVRAVVYSVSRFSELIAPIKTVMLTRDREEDRRRMESELRSGRGLVVCPEGTTCREPFLLRFSPLFAELTEEVVPVAIKVHVSTFYGTTAGGFKSLDPVFMLMNPFTSYKVEFLEKVKTTTGGGSSIDAANHVQGVIGRALGFECTSLTRKDKYMILAGKSGK
ncbi:putative glycerol-3-phosphate acyltransferase 3 [Acorus gramineus]|uniref:Glycerol-3-phosphate acyltransferase 3 n=1 Tax=Acorus gramineus TaxID=55184 RepID=A0AAV9BW58_ACOGR|nr:putative glycerol-3-phosphate acyltransferase 3 [Acorus gramineus]